MPKFETGCPLPISCCVSTFENAKILIGHLAIEGSIFVGDEVDDMNNEDRMGYGSTGVK